MKQLLVTGLTGFVGRNLQALLMAGAAGDWQLYESARFDLLDPQAIDRALANGCPDAVIHLAGQTFVPEAFRDPARTLQVNLLGTLNLLQALKRRGFGGTFLYVSSGDVYGQVAEADLPVVETLVPHPRNPYAVSKVSAELLCQQWSYAEPWRIILARPFNHIGLGQSESFVIAGMARQIARIRLGLQAPVLDVGDVDVSRDFLAVQDVIAAYLALLERGRSGQVYNVCSGQERSIRSLIEEMAGLAGVQIELKQDPGRLRRADQRRVCGSSVKLREETGWEPKRTITETLRSLLSDWEIREKNNDNE